MPFLQANGIRLHYEVQGSGHPLVCIMGLGYGAWAWHRLAPLLAARYEVITFDNRGAGQSDKPEGPYTVPMMAADTAGLLDALGIRDAYVFGVSLGGLIAQDLVWLRPDLASKLILAATMHGGSKAMPVTPKALAVIAETGGDSLDLARRRILQAWAPDFGEQHSDLLQELLDYRLGEPVPPAAYLAQGQAGYGYSLLSEEDVDRRLRSIKIPTLVLYGEFDRVVPTGNAQLLQLRIPGSRIAEIKGGGHMFIFERPGETARAVVEFLG